MAKLYRCSVVSVAKWGKTVAIISVWGQSFVLGLKPEEGEYGASNKFVF